MSDEQNQTYLALFLAGTVPVIWIALLLAPYLFTGGIFSHLADMTNALNNPLSITWTEDSLKNYLPFSMYLWCRYWNLLFYKKELSTWRRTWKCQMGFHYKSE